jgi:hypothetical protein
MTLTQRLKGVWTKARKPDTSVLKVGLEPHDCAYLILRVFKDLGVTPPVEAVIDEFFDHRFNSPIDLGDIEPMMLLESLAEKIPDGELYFECLATLAKRRLKYRRILESQPIPYFDEVGPRALLQIGDLPSEQLIALLKWRKWIFTIDNRAGQETGYVFEPVIAAALGGEACGSSKSPVRQKRHAPKPPVDEDPYAKVKEKARARNAAVAMLLAGRDIGELPEVEDIERKARAAGSFQFFCEAYFKSHVSSFVVAGPHQGHSQDRGSGRSWRLILASDGARIGKSSLAEVACIWAVLNGYRDFVCLIGSDEGHACDMLDSIKTELDANELLLADYPEVCFPIQALDGISNRANGQLYQGKRTQIGWTAKEIVLPTIAGSKASGAIIKVAGLTGRIRGMKFKRPDGKTVRPSLVVLDDPQTDESARSLSQCANREAILAGAVLGLAGPGKKISGIMPCTVIRPGDMADNILNRDKHPEWNGERTRMMNAFPTNETLWHRYAEIRSEGLRAGDGGAAGTEFYRQNRAAMDAGADVSWKERFNHDELSAIQHAMNLKLQDEAAFFAEYQNEPLPEETVGADQLTADQVAAKINHMPRARVPIAGNHLTAFIDVQGKLLFYVVAAWEDDFTGYVVDYGSYPDQQRTYFTFATRDTRWPPPAKERDSKAASTPASNP